MVDHWLRGQSGAARICPEEKSDRPWSALPRQQGAILIRGGQRRSFRNANHASDLASVSATLDIPTPRE